MVNGHKSMKFNEKQKSLRILHTKIRYSQPKKQKESEEIGIYKCKEKKVKQESIESE
jgi:hypothetical protein